MNSPTTWPCHIVVALACTFSLSADITAATAQTARPYYQGKAITLLSNFPAGGGTDIWTRLHARHIGRFIAGKPTVIVENRGGATGLVGYSWFAKVPAADGLTIGMLGGNLPRQEALGTLHGGVPSVLKNKIIAGSQDVDVFIGRREVFADGFRSFLKLSRRPIYIALTGTNDGLRDISMMKLLQKEPQKDFVIVKGFRGGNEIFLAMNRGEIDLYATHATTYNQTPKREVEAGNWVSLWQGGIPTADGGLTRDQNVQEIPTFLEVYESLYGTRPSGREWDYVHWHAATNAAIRFIAVPPGTPDHIVAILREAWSRMREDPEFIAEAEKLGADTVVPAEQTAAIIEQVLKPPPSIATLLQAPK